jgi:hypothetical protein
MVAGEHIVHEELPYDPATHYAITALDSGYLLIAECRPSAIHIHEAASGREVGTLTHLDLQAAEDEYVYGMRYSHEDNVLHLCTGDGHKIRSLHAYRVSTGISISYRTAQMPVQHYLTNLTYPWFCINLT